MDKELNFPISPEVYEYNMLNIRNISPYSILQVNTRATDEQIIASYRLLARKYHPDKNKDENSGAIFKRITEAYDIMSDKQKKDDYTVKQIGNIFKDFKKEFPITSRVVAVGFVGVLLMVTAVRTCYRGIYFILSSPYNLWNRLSITETVVKEDIPESVVDEID